MRDYPMWERAHCRELKKAPESGSDGHSPLASGAYCFPIFGIPWHSRLMIVIGTDVVERHLADHAGCKGIRVARSQYDAWLAIVSRAEWRNPEDVKTSYPRASILKAGRAVFKIKGNDYRLVARVQYQAGVLAIRFFGTHAEYDKIDAENA
jgi:mRNA interferase HigB